MKGASALARGREGQAFRAPWASTGSSSGCDSAELREFTRKLLADLHALEKMLADGVIESGVTRVGAEQELVLVDSRLAPGTGQSGAPRAPRRRPLHHRAGQLQYRVQSRPDRPPQRLPARDGGSAPHLAGESAAAPLAEIDTSIVLTGILPTLEKSDLTLDNMTPVPRYFQLNEAMTRLRGRNYDFRIKGRDELLDRARQRDAGSVQHELPGPLPGLAGALRHRATTSRRRSPLRFSPRQPTRHCSLAAASGARPASPCSSSRSTPAHRSAHLRDLSPRVSFGRQLGRELGARDLSGGSGPLQGHHEHRGRRGPTRHASAADGRRNCGLCACTTAPSTAGTDPATASPTASPTCASRIAFSRPGRLFSTKSPTPPSGTA